MPKRWVGLTVFVVLVAVAAGGAWWLTRPASTQVSAKPPKAAPAVGSCWNVNEKTAATAFPWRGRPVDCGARHTAEVFHIGQAAKDLVAKLGSVNGTDAKVIQNLMDAQARRACIVIASNYLGDDWHRNRVQVIADWIKPASTGHFGCALVESPAPASKRFVARTGSLRGALTAAGPLAIACVARDSTSQVYRSCDAPHDGEFVGTYTITPPEAPFDAAKVRDAASTGCGLLVTRYVGADRSDLRAGYVGPSTAGDWLGSDQTYACYAIPTGTEPLTRTIKALGSGPLPR